MKKKLLVTVILSACFFSTRGQKTAYYDSLQSFRDKYINEHEVVKGENKKSLGFYPVDERYRFTARFEKAKAEPWFSIPTSGKVMKDFRIYGTLYFSVHDTTLSLIVLQSKNLLTFLEYKDYLLIAFTDITSGHETYENGRYIDATVQEMETGFYQLDFNKAYNPYCAYVSNVYNCPVPPQENNLPVAIKAGEKKFAK